ncbi:hypothetical protein LQW54_012901 [Pestalotiopsis sp. IQ-011]
MRKYPLTHVPILALKLLTVFCLFQCAALHSSSLAGSLYFPDATLYDARLESYWSRSAALAPACMVLPTSPEDVSDTKIVSVSPGGNWQRVYEALAPHGVTVTGGRAGTVGVGGFVTGGGNSFHSAELGTAQPYGYRHIWLVGAYKNDARVIRYIMQKHEEILARLAPTFPAESGFNTFCAFQPITQTMLRHGAEKGGNVLGLEDRVRGGNGIMFLVGVGVYGAEDEAGLWPVWQAWFDDVEDYATSLGANWDWHYLNYASQGQDAIASYGDESVELIRKAAAKYDPNQVFQKLRKSGFKTPVEPRGERYPLYGPAAQDDGPDYQSPLE